VLSLRRTKFNASPRLVPASALLATQPPGGHRVQRVGRHAPARQGPAREVGSRPSCVKGCRSANTFTGRRGPKSAKIRYSYLFAPLRDWRQNPPVHRRDGTAPRPLAWLALTAQDSVPRLRRHIAGDTAQGGGATPFFLSSRGKFWVKCCGYGPPVERYRSAIISSAEAVDPSSIEWPPVRNRQVDPTFFSTSERAQFCSRCLLRFSNSRFSGRRPVRWSFFVTGV